MLLSFAYLAYIGAQMGGAVLPGVSEADGAVDVSGGIPGAGGPLEGSSGDRPPPG
jgi:hypothetical protein